MTAHTENPYQSPHTPTADTPPSAKPAEVGCKQIAKRWEILRLPCNVIVGLAGLLALAMIPTLTWREIIVGVVAYGLGANSRSNRKRAFAGLTAKGHLLIRSGRCYNAGCQWNTPTNYLAI